MQFIQVEKKVDFEKKNNNIMTSIIYCDMPICKK